MNDEDFHKLKELEEALWIPSTRFNKEFMERVLSPEFFEFGRSGRIYNREETLLTPPQDIIAKLPFKNFKIHPVSKDVVLVTYTSEVQKDKLESANRSSLWLKTSTSWQLLFHQGTPVERKV